MSSATRPMLERLLERHRHVVGVALGDHRCTCGAWDWRDGNTTHTAHLADVIIETVCELVWNEGYIHGYEMPDVESDFKPLGPYSPDRTPFDYGWREVGDA